MDDWQHPIIDSVQPPSSRYDPLSTYQYSYGCRSQPDSLVNDNRKNYHHQNHHYHQHVLDGERSMTPSTSTNSNGSNHDANLPLFMLSSINSGADHSHRASPDSKPVRSCAVLFNCEPIERPVSPSDQKKSEYHSKFKDFNEYAYVSSVEGSGRWIRKSATATPTPQKSRSTEDEPDAKTSLPAAATAAAAKDWYTEVEERNQQACKYRARSLMGASNMQHSWDGTTTAATKDREFQALALATRMLIEERRKKANESGKQKPGNAAGVRSSSAKPTARFSAPGSATKINNNNNSAPSSLREDVAQKPRPVPRKAAPAPPSAAKASPAPATVSISKPKSAEAKLVDKNNNTTTRSKPRSATAAAGSKTTPAPEAKKIWIKPKPSPVTNGSGGSGGVSDVSKPEVREYEVEPKSVPLRNTEIKSPEQITGVKSPSPESWKVSIEKGGLNWVNGTAKPVNFSESITDHHPDGMVRPVPINGKAQ